MIVEGWMIGFRQLWQDVDFKVFLFCVVHIEIFFM